MCTRLYGFTSYNAVFTVKSIFNVQVIKSINNAACFFHHRNLRLSQIFGKVRKRRVGVGSLMSPEY